jgi:hypothetical protein
VIKNQWYAVLENNQVMKNKALVAKRLGEIFAEFSCFSEQPL